MKYCRYCHFCRKNPNSLGYICIVMKKYRSENEIKHVNNCQYYEESIYGDVITGNKYSTSQSIRQKQGQMPMFYD